MAQNPIQSYFDINTASTRNIKSHFHWNLELAYVQSGKILHESCGQKKVLKEGDYFIVDHHVFHSYKAVSEESLSIRNFMFTPDFLDPRLTGKTRLSDIMTSSLLRSLGEIFPIDPNGAVFHDEDRAVQRRLDALEEEHKKKRFGHKELERYLLMEVLILTARKLSESLQPAPANRAVARLAEYARRHFNEKVRLSDLARKFGYSVPYLSELFSREMGLTFVGYLEQIRLDHACHLLTTTDQKISHIAEQVGYRDVRFFNDIFKKNLSLTPREFRKLL